MRARLVVAPLACLLMLAGCGTLPQRKGEPSSSDKAISAASGSNVLARVSALKAAADAALDDGALADIEAGSLVRIDQGSFAIRRQLGLEVASPELSAADVVIAGSFDRYPLWFVTVAAAPAEETRAAIVFVRTSTTSPWQAVMAPRMALETTLAPVASTEDGAAELVEGDDATGLPASPDEVARHYADVLADAGSGEADGFEVDSFITQMRATVAAQPTEHVVFSQTWRAEPVRYALRLADGGALVFADLHRTDRYRIVGRHELGFTGSEASTYLGEPVSRSASLAYSHEVLLYVPADGKAYALGQYGGLTGATGS